MTYGTLIFLRRRTVGIGGGGGFSQDRRSRGVADLLSTHPLGGWRKLLTHCPVFVDVPRWELTLAINSLL